MTILDKLNDIKPEIKSLADKYEIGELRIFGSVARREDNENSDIDMLYKWKNNVKNYDYFGFLIDLENLTGRDISLISPRKLHWFIKDKVLSESIPFIIEGNE